MTDYSGTTYGRMLEEAGKGSRAVVSTTESEEQPPIRVYVRVDEPVDAHTATVRVRVSKAVSSISSVEHLGEEGSLALISDADLNGARERLWQLLEKLDDEAEKRHCNPPAGITGPIDDE